MVLERDVERKLRIKVEWMIPGSMCMKFVSPGKSGVPDRVILLPHGFTVWVEVKRPGEIPRPLQTAMHKRMAETGAMVMVVDNYDAVDLLVTWCKDWLTAWEDNEPIPDPPEKLMWYNWKKR